MAIFDRLSNLLLVHARFGIALRSRNFRTSWYSLGMPGAREGVAESKRQLSTKQTTPPFLIKEKH
jgi:hypothetical protein